METIFERIYEAQRIIDQRKLLKSKQEMLISPVLKDTEMIPVILESIRNLYHNSSEIPGNKYPLRDYFILIVMLLYCPRVFTGEPMNRGLRDVIAETIGVTPAHVSNQIHRLWEWCRWYNDFRKGVWDIYNKITAEID